MSLQTQESCAAAHRSLEFFNLLNSIDYFRCNNPLGRLLLQDIADGKVPNMDGADRHHVGVILEYFRAQIAVATRPRATRANYNRNPCHACVNGKTKCVPIEPKDGEYLCRQCKKFGLDVCHKSNTDNPEREKSVTMLDIIPPAFSSLGSGWNNYDSTSVHPHSSPVNEASGQNGLISSTMNPSGPSNIGYCMGSGTSTVGMHATQQDFVSPTFFHSNFSNMGHNNSNMPCRVISQNLEVNPPFNYEGQGPSLLYNPGSTESLTAFHNNEYTKHSFENFSAESSTSNLKFPYSDYKSYGSGEM
ncbi:uncharacterized protein FOMMEDRAFT_160800 [Fomitiporia mediterranea MF3/22]|uniref:uncharacterized protein n=1 Tax=Fomitiporia mediterranea (strain MF3/22) TaxID=694068 RepID=UPI0004409535|nr:uncharacterized protein FOMMEDRAFT_160800 [Fomitiporia mediterranea MF3/22]EJC99219.1 hypothetical protein FOMMEDRAFT_160800 [Fomitiporia mediterranea MF3/22]